MAIPSGIGSDTSHVIPTLPGGRISQPVEERNRFLDGVERLGNALPDPALIFVGMIAVLMAVSAVGAAAGWSAVNPVTGETLSVKSLLSEQSLQLLITEMPRTYAGFAPLGVVLTIMLGAGVADRSGLFTALVRASLTAVPTRALIPVVMLTGMLTCHALDAGYIVFVPLAGLIFARAGRHPILGVAVGFAGVGVGLSGNLLPGAPDVLSLSITETGARLIQPDWTMNPLGNWWFGAAIAVLFTGLGWIVAERILAPRLGTWKGDGPASTERVGDAAHASGTARPAGSRVGRNGCGRLVRRAVALAGLHTALRRGSCTRPAFDAAVSRADTRIPPAVPGHRVGVRCGRRHDSIPSRCRRNDGEGARRHAAVSGASCSSRPSSSPCSGGRTWGRSRRSSAPTSYARCRRHPHCCYPY